MAVGHYRRVHLPISSILHLAVEGVHKNARGGCDAGRRWSGTSFCMPSLIHFQFSVGLELVQCFKRSVLPFAEVQDQRIYFSSTGRKIDRGNCVRHSMTICVSFNLMSPVSEIVGEYGQRPLYRMLGYFSIIGLLRVHVHIGDFTLALKVMQNVELNQKVCYPLRFTTSNLL